MIVWEFFSCAGGMALGARAAGLPVSVAFDWDKDARDSYERGLGHRPIGVDAKELVRMFDAGVRPPRVDLAIFDPPCTPWSRAGKRQGTSDERDLIHVTVGLVRLLQPRCWLIANVPGLDDGPNWPTVQATIGSLQDCYAIDFRRLDAADYGVPQRRVRPFWFGRPHSSAPLAWPLPTHGDPADIGHGVLGDSRVPWVTCRDALGHLPPEALGQEIRVRQRVAGHKNHQSSNADAPARTLTKNTHSDGALLVHERHPLSHADDVARCITAGDGGGARGSRVVEWPWDRPATSVLADDRLPPTGHHHGSFLSARELDRPATTVCAGIDKISRPGQSNSRDGTSQSTNAIKLSQRAALILQGFPDGYFIAGKTKRARWSQIGQAMPPPLSAAVFKSIKRWLSQHDAAGIVAALSEIAARGAA